MVEGEQMRLRITGKLLVLLGLVVALMSVGIASAVAQGGDEGLPDPQTTNVPYVAWAGEQVKVVKCLGSEDSAAALKLGLTDPFFIGAAKFVVEDWSGVDENNSGPRFLNDVDGNVIPFEQSDGRVCFGIHVTSQKPGMAVIKMAVRDDFLNLFPGADPWLKHQFLVIWLQSQAPTLVEVPTPGDPTGNGVFNPIPGAGPGGTNAFLPGLVKVNVKGTFPLGNDFAGLGHATVTLPDDWAWLAQHFAVDDTITGSNFPGAASMDWDIHDDQAPTEDHTVTSFCTDKVTTTAIDAVDNCLGGGDTGPFSRVIGGTNSDTIGPFDPLFPNETLLSDGKLDSGDAPMPALRVDVALGAGSTVGSLSKADKSNIYSRDGLGTPSAHNLYAPFYQAYIPTVVPGGDGSGVAGSIANNFTGFLGDGLYDYWDTFTVHTRSGFNACNDVLGNPFPLPTGDDDVAVYTDEHGEAYVQFNPYVGAVLTPDSNGRCDIYHPGVLGTATITATSVYPDQPVLWDQGPKTSPAITKTVNSLANKTLACVPKGTNEAFCVETILDAQGNPVEGASVEFTAQAGQGSQPKIQPDATAGVPPYNTLGQGILSTSPDAVRLTTNAFGQAGISVVSSTNACINVDVENIGTRNGGAGIFRFANFNPTTGTACTQGGGGTTTPPPGGGTGGTGGGGGNAGGGGGGGNAGGGGTPAVTAAPVAISAPVPTAQATAPAAKPAKTAKASLVSAIVVKTKTGRYLNVRVSSSSRTAKIKITLIGKNHKVSRVVLRTVATNRTVRVPNLKLGPSVRTVKVALA
jgi:hypothetical protein